MQLLHPATAGTEVVLLQEVLQPPLLDGTDRLRQFLPFLDQQRYTLVVMLYGTSVQVHLCHGIGDGQQ